MTIYKNLNKVQNACQNFNKLQQMNDKSFHQFYVIFLFLTLLLDINKTTLIIYLEKKVNPQLQIVLVTILLDFISLIKLQRYLQKIDKKQRYN